MSKRSNRDSSYFWLLVDDQRYAVHYLYATEYAPSGSITINLELEAGQIVRVENDYATVIFGTGNDGAIHSWFTGHLLYSL